MALNISLSKLIAQRVASILNIPNRSFSGWEKTTAIRNSFSNQQSPDKGKVGKTFSKYVKFGGNPWDTF